jgi:hypothetical protein
MKTRHRMAHTLLRPEYQNMKTILRELAEDISTLKADSWLLLHLHLERNPTGLLRHDFIVIYLLMCS